MPFLTIAGIDVSVVEMAEREPEYIGDRGRTYNGTWRGNTSGEIRAWQGTGLEVPAGEYHELRSAVRRGPVEVQGDAIYGGWPRRMRVQMSGEYIRDGAGYLIVPSFTMEDAQVHGAALHYYPGSGLLAHSRADAAAVATYVDRYGLIRTVSAPGDLRDDHWIDSNRYTLLELGRTNLLLQSEDFTTTWSVVGTPVITANDASAPDGTTTADKIEDDATGANEQVSQTVTVPDDSVTRTVSVFVRKRSGGPIAGLLLAYTGGTAQVYGVHLDPSNGDVALESGRATPAGYGVEDFNDEWWRLWIAGANNTSGNTSAVITVAPARASTLGGASSGTPTGHHHFWGAMLEVGAFPTSYIKTTTASVARATETAFSTLPAAITTPTALTLYVRFIERGTKTMTGNSAGPANVGGENSRYFGFQVSNTGQYRARHHNGSSSVESTQSAAPEIGDLVELVGILHADGSVACIQSINGGTPTSAARSAALPLAAAWGADRFDLNSRAGARIGAAAISRALVKTGAPTEGTASDRLIYLRGEAA